MLLRVVKYIEVMIVHHTKSTFFILSHTHPLSLMPLMFPIHLFYVNLLYLLHVNDVISLHVNHFIQSIVNFVFTLVASFTVL